MLTLRYKLCFIFLLACFVIKAQTPIWISTLGSSQNERAYYLDKDIAGNIYYAGYFSGTVDFDQSLSVFNLTSNGSEDAYVAKYSANGQFQWAIKIGGSDYDAITGLKINNAGEVLVTGYFRGIGVDFDPSSSTYLLDAPGLGGANLNYGGDVFLAKYTNNGQFVWAFEFGGSYSHDKPEDIDVDNNDNIYLVGAINATSTYPIDADPGAGFYDLAGGGHGFVAKYTTNANFVWAFTLGEYGLNSGGTKIKVDPNDSTFVVVGFFRGTNVDFDPNAGVFNLSSNAAEDGFAAKYSLNKNFIWGLEFGGAGPEMFADINIDTVGDIYVCGWLSGSNVDLDPSVLSALLSSNGGIDAIIGKYSKSGNYLWAYSFGSSGNDYCEGLSQINNKVYYTGSFLNTIDFDPSTSIMNKTSIGGLDIFISTFDTLGNFQCVSTIGGSLGDKGQAIRSFHSDTLFMCGSYNSNNMDFDPSTNIFSQANSGSEDAFLAKYVNSNLGSVYTPSLLPDTICSGQIPQLTINLSPFTNAIFSVTYSDGLNTYTISNVTSGVPFSLQTAYSSSTTISITNLSFSSNVGCINSSISLPTNVVIDVLPLPIITVIASNTNICNGDSTILTASGTNTFIWTNGVQNGVGFSPTSTTTYTVTGTDINGCSNTSTKVITILPTPTIQAIATPPSICKGQSTILNASGATSYAWSGGIINGMTISPNVSTTYTVTGTDANGCTNTSSVTVNVVNSLAISINPSLPSLCIGDTLSLTASGATNYSWSPILAISNPNLSAVLVYPNATTTYTVTGSNATGCTGTSNVTVQVDAYPILTVTKSGDVECANNKVTLTASGANAYGWMPANVLSNSSGSSTIASLQTATTFTVTGTSGACATTDSIHVDYYNNDENSIFIPNAFSPNGDGKNDCFSIVSNANFIHFELAIYNRWGELVFISETPEICWEGYYKAELAEVGAYYYYLKAETKCGKLLKKGDLTLLR